MAKNDITGDSLRTKAGTSEAFSSGWDLIWGKKNGSTTGVSKPDLDEAIKKAECDNEDCGCKGNCSRES